MKGKKMSLKQQVRDYEDTPSVASVIKDEFFSDKKGNKMDELKVKLEQYHVVDYGDLEDYLAKQLNKPGIRLCDVNNDSDYVIDCPSNYVWDEFDKEDFEEAKKDKDIDIRSLQLYMQKLVDECQIPAGKYLVKVCW